MSILFDLLLFVILGVPQTPWGHDGAPPGLCDGAGGPECGRRLESQYHHPDVSRDGDVLTINLKNGDTITFEDVPEGESYERKYFAHAGYISPFHLIRVQHYESVSAQLVHERAGTVTPIGWLPLLAPNHQHLAWCGESTVTLWERKGEGYRRIYSASARGMRFPHCEWIDNSTVTACNGDSCIELVLVDGSWVHSVRPSNPELQ